MMLTNTKQRFLTRCRERGYALADVMGCVVKQDGDQWTIDTDHPAYPRAKTKPKTRKSTTPNVSNEELEHRKTACLTCKHLRHTKHNQPYCKRNCKRNGKTCQRLAVGKYTVAMLKPEPWCEPWKQCYSTSPQPKDNPAE